VPSEREHAERTFAAGFGQRARAGHCAECGASCSILAIWCDEHRKRGPRGPGLDSFEELEASHARKIAQYAARGQV
jgi:hypothetical protein